MKLTASISRSLFTILLVFTLVFGVFGAAPAVADSGTVYSFDSGLEGWTTIDNDGDGQNWFWSGDFTSIYTYYFL